MPTRREFLSRTAAGVVVAAASVRFTHAVETTAAIPHAGVGVSRIKGAIRREDTLLRLGGECDGFHMSWAANDRQFVALQDGTGWFKNPKGSYNSRLWTIAGEPRNARIYEVSSYPDLIDFTGSRPADAPRYYGFGTLAVDGRIYQFLATLNRKASWVGAKLIYSPDDGHTWCNQDGSTPVVWETWESRSSKTMVFFEEPQEAFSLLSILQMGKNYEANRDGYVYVYGTNGAVDGTINQLVMFRVPKAGILNRSAYEYFSGLKADGNPTWTKDIDARALVHTFPTGWVNKADHPDEMVVEAWLPSVTYNDPLGVYLMANYGIGCAPDGSWYGKPSYLGFWVGSDPWGPWTQIHEETAWMPGNDPAARAYDLQIAPKWIAADGKSFWLVWCDFQGWKEYLPPALEMMRKGHVSREDMKKLVALRQRTMPYYSFNTQRVDLIVK